MSITTKQGDKGMTSLLWGRQVRKDDIRVEAGGALDELCSYLGLARSLISEGAAKKILEDIQKDLFVMGAEITAGRKFSGRLKNRIDNNYTKRLEGSIKGLEKKIKLGGHCFLLPGENLVSAVLDVCRTVARRTERIIVTLKHKNMANNPHTLTYLNRLSDLLYLLARCHEKRQRKPK
jgi:cob(I)alamin adenosyltransferase